MSIEEKITRKICRYCYSGDSNDELEVIEYGISLLIETVFKMLILLLISIMLGKLFEFFCFVIVFCPLRSQAGGFHCKTNIGCTISLFVIYGASLLFDYIEISKPALFAAFIACFIICSIFAPSSTENNPINDRNIKLRKKIVSLIILLLIYLEYMIEIVHVTKGCIFVTFLSISILILLQEGKNYGKE